METESEEKPYPDEVVNEKAVEILKCFQRMYFGLDWILRKLPGVTESNFRKLMSECASLSELAGLSEERLAEIMESSKNAKSLYGFLHCPCPRIGHL